VGGGGGVYEGMGFEEKRFERFLGGGGGCGTAQMFGYLLSFLV